MAHLYTFLLPDIGEGVVEGEVVEWLKNVGDSVAKDEPVVIVMTDKATVELPAPHAGKLLKQHYQPGEMALLDQPLYVLEVESAIEEKTCHSPPKKASEPLAPPSRTKPSGKALATPPIRKLARDLGIDLSQVQATGKEGRVTVEDLKRHTHNTPTQPPPLHLPGDEERPLIGIQHLMADKMAASKRTIPHFSYMEQVDATRLVQMRRTYKEEAQKEGIHVTFLPFIIRALSLTLTRFPLVNSSLDTENQKIIIHKQHNIGIAMSTERGLIVPVLKNVQEQSLQEIITSYHALKDSAVHNRLLPDAMKGSTISISNFGVLSGGGLWGTPIINFPESAILAFAKIQKQPVVKNDQVVACEILNLSWSFDHRFIDGDLAAGFSHYFSTLIRNPAPLI